MTELLRRSDAPHKSIRCYSLLSATLKSCSCWGNRALLQVMARICHQTSAEHGPGAGTVKCAQAENSALQDWKGQAWEQLRRRQSYPLVCVSEMQLTFLLVLLHFSERPDEILVWKVTEHGSVAQRAYGAGKWLSECQSTGCVLRAMAWGMTLPCAPSRAHTQHYLHG